ncbi:MAG: hypothetical protein ABH851_00740 [Methanobacteriota archaeon]
MKEEQLRKLKEEGGEVTDLGTSHIVTQLHALCKHRFDKFKKDKE